MPRLVNFWPRGTGGLRNRSRKRKEGRRAWAVRRDEDGCLAERERERDTSNRETRSTILLSFPFHVAPRNLSICLANVQANSEIRVITWRDTPFLYKFYLTKKRTQKFGFKIIHVQEIILYLFLNNELKRKRKRLFTSLSK